jgi:hypothetical protein
MEARELVKFIDKADTISRNMRVVYEDYWNKLRIEDAPLRIICGEDLISVPMTYFDDALLRLATREWQRMARIVAKVLDGYFSDGINQVSDIVLGARLAALAEAGKLEWKGDLSNMRQCELRLPLD